MQGAETVTRRSDFERDGKLIAGRKLFPVIPAAHNPSEDLTLYPAFSSYVRRVLISEIIPGRAVILDNLAIH